MSVTTSIPQPAPSASTVSHSPNHVLARALARWVGPLVMLLALWAPWIVNPFGGEGANYWALVSRTWSVAWRANGDAFLAALWLTLPVVLAAWAAAQAFRLRAPALPGLLGLAWAVLTWLFVHGYMASGPLAQFFVGLLASVVGMGLILFGLGALAAVLVRR